MRAVASDRGVRLRFHQRAGFPPRDERGLLAKRVREFHDVKQGSRWRGCARVTADSQSCMPRAHSVPVPRFPEACSGRSVWPSRMVRAGPCLCCASRCTCCCCGVRCFPAWAGVADGAGMRRSVMRCCAIRASPAKQGGVPLPVKTSQVTDGAVAIRFERSVRAGSGDRSTGRVGVNR